MNYYNRARSFASPDDVISTMWGYFLDGLCIRDKFTTLNECIRMTKMALAQGCDVYGNESIRSTRIPVNPLFRMSHGFLNRSGIETAREAIETILNLGYDVEERNYKGLTSLLYTASMCTPIAVRSLKALVGRNVDLKATDPQGKGALHIALGAPELIDGWPNFILKDEWGCKEEIFPGLCTIS